MTRKALRVALGAHVVGVVLPNLITFSAVLLGPPVESLSEPHTLLETVGLVSAVLMLVSWSATAIVVSWSAAAAARRSERAALEVGVAVTAVLVAGLYALSLFGLDQIIAPTREICVSGHLVAVGAACAVRSWPLRTAVIGAALAIVSLLAVTGQQAIAASFAEHRSFDALMGTAALGGIVRVAAWVSLAVALSRRWEGITPRVDPEVFR